MNQVDESLRTLSDGEVKLKLSVWVPSSMQYYYLIENNNGNVIGNCGIRLLDNEKNQYLGNIEYEIFPQYRGNNYAEKASRLLSKVALYHNVDKLIITANTKNTPSLKTIENLGGVFIGVKKVPRNMRLHKTSKHVAIYNWNLEKEGEKYDRY